MQSVKKRLTDELKAAALAYLDRQSDGWAKLREAADHIGRHRATVYRWYATDERFRLAIQRINKRNIDAYIKQLEREQAARKAVINAHWRAKRQALAAYARSCKRR